MNWKFWKRDTSVKDVVENLMIPDLSKLGDYSPPKKSLGKMTREELAIEAALCFERTIQLCGDDPSMLELKNSAMTRLARLNT